MNSGVSSPPRRKSQVKRRDEGQGAPPATPIVDVFAGCGGFSEGFLSYANGDRDFKLALAIDSDPSAHTTHLVRAFFHQFKELPEEYYELLRQHLTIDELFSRFPDEADKARASVLELELGAGVETDELLHQKIDERIHPAQDWVLIGGPPCQAYSVAGRSRNRGNADYVPEEDGRHFLYREYLKILVRHWPSVFVMENVPGILNAKIHGEPIWPKILTDLTDPIQALEAWEHDGVYDGYYLYSLVTPVMIRSQDGVPVLKPDDFVVKCEEHGIPQSRHRVFILGVRADIKDRMGGFEPPLLDRLSTSVSTGDLLQSLPPIRSWISKGEDDPEEWLRTMRQLLDAKFWAKNRAEYEPILEQAKKALKGLVVPKGGKGGEFVSWKKAAKLPVHLEWLSDPRIGGVCNHESKSHMRTDIHRYVFAASHAKANRDPLRLVHFPNELLPEHQNVQSADRKNLSHSNFSDRFAVQRSDSPARTIVSHISKDGHYYIHPEPSQGRSLTVREAARLQTFPDNFYFPGPKTEQYKQVGNAVPPHLAIQIAKTVDAILSHIQQ